ncbi:hypothetical protein [Antribacter gilvus]|uniref:hypothetical protein n=1 Tax=Antribacter gilvus TaxID=2304675 RepID=UPI000F796138|nr:hypothetical protein [Antribacter gilvus]
MAHFEDPPRPVPVDPVAPMVAKEGKKKIDWAHVGRRALWVLVLVVLAWLLVLLLAAFLPRWWAQVIGNAVDGSFSAGAWWGLMIGAVFTGLPVAAAAQAVLPGRGPRIRATWLVVALVLAIPNLLTLAVVLGTNEAAHAGERILDVDAPAFRGGTAWGAVLGAVLAIAVVVLGALYRRRGRRLRELQKQHPKA